MWSFIFVFTILVAVCCFGICYLQRPGTEIINVDDNGILTPDETCALRGLAMFIIMFSHLADPSVRITYFFYVSGALGVAVCFTVSGYGLGKGYQRKDKYLEHFLLFKFLRCLLPYFILYLFYILIAGKEAQIAYEIPRLQMAGAPLWYLKVQLLLYILFYLIYRYFLFEKYKIWALVICCLGYCFILHHYAIESYWYKTCLFFPIGVWLASNDYIILPILRTKTIRCCLLALSLLVFIIIYFWGRLGHELLIDGIYSLFFTLFALSTSQYIPNSYLLNMMGIYSMEVYLIHCLVLRLVGDYFPGTNALSFITLTVLILLLSIPLHWVCTQCITKLRKKIE